MAGEGAGDNESGDGGEVAEFEQLGVDAEVPVVVLNLAFEQGDAGASAFEALGGAHNADVVPHGATQFVPIVTDDDTFVGIGAAEVPPSGNGRGAGAFGSGEVARNGEARAMGDDDGFEEGVTGESIGAVEASASDFAAGVESGSAVSPARLVATPPQV